MRSVTLELPCRRNRKMHSVQAEFAHYTIKSAEKPVNIRLSALSKQIKKQVRGGRASDFVFSLYYISIGFHKPTIVVALMRCHHFAFVRRHHYVHVLVTNCAGPLKPRAILPCNIHFYFISVIIPLFALTSSINP